MSGIGGIVRFDGKSPPAAEGERISRILALRGADDSGTFHQGAALMVHRGNAVVPHGVPQPLVNERFVLCLDGRLYDHMGLARQPRAQDSPEPRALDDSQVLLEAWQSRGLGCLEQLDGAWSFALWDRKEELLTLARGRMGLRPMYYTVAGSAFAFASLPSALAALPWVSRDLAPEGLCEYLAFRYVHAPRTLLRDVLALPPGCVLQVSTRGTRISRHAALRFCFPGAPMPSRRESLLELDRLLRLAVIRRCRRGSPVGVLLSGGLDSSLLAKYAISAGHSVHTYHVVFEDTGVDEAAFAARVATLQGTRHRVVRVDSSSFVDALDTCVAAMGEPITNPAAIPQYILLDRVHRDLRMVLCGAGGDQLMAGGLVAMAARAVGRRGGRLLPSFVLDRKPGEPPMVACTPRSRISRGAANWVGGTEVFDPAARRDLLQDGLDTYPDIRHQVLAPLYANLDTDPVNAVLGIYQQGWLPQDTVARSDRMGAAAGVEVRYPMLDRQVSSYLNALPGAWKIRRHMGRTIPKWPVQALLKDSLPKAVMDRPKGYFPSPLHLWLRSDGAPFLQRRLERLLDNRWRLWKPDVVRDIARKHNDGSENLGDKLWVLIFLDAWLEHIHSAGG